MISEELYHSGVMLKQRSISLNFDPVCHWPLKRQPMSLDQITFEKSGKVEEEDKYREVIREVQLV